MFLHHICAYDSYQKHAYAISMFYEILQRLEVTYFY